MLKMNNAELINKIYRYTIDELATGIVMADNIEDAREKVEAAYKAHNDCYDEQRTIFPFGNWMKIRGLQIILM